MPQADKRQVIIVNNFLDLVMAYSLTDLTDIYEHGIIALARAPEVDIDMKLSMCSSCAS